MKKNRSLFIGLSVIAGVIGTMAITKKNKNQIDYQIKQHLPKFIGNWAFFLPEKIKVHHLTIDQNQKIFINGRDIQANIDAINEKQIRLLDSYGYFLVFEIQNDDSGQLYDEADDIKYMIERS